LSKAADAGLTAVAGGARSTGEVSVGAARAAHATGVVLAWIVVDAKCVVSDMPASHSAVAEIVSATDMVVAAPRPDTDAATAEIARAAGVRVLARTIPRGVLAQGADDIRQAGVRGALVSVVTIDGRVRALSR